MRDLKDLEKNALRHWPSEIIEEEKDISIIPKLINSQDKFISILNVADSTPFVWKDILEATAQMPSNLFLKHLMVLSDYGGEKIKKIKQEIRTLLGGDIMTFTWNNDEYNYEFKSLDSRSTWTNTSLKVDSKGINKSIELNESIEDLIMLILFGGFEVNGVFPEEINQKCSIGGLLGKSEQIETFVRQRYIWVSRITGGATVNSMGNLAQKYVAKYLSSKLPSWDFSKKTIPFISQNNRTPLSFDIVAKSPNEKYCAIEISFQETTNSVIERKAGQARGRKVLLNGSDHKIVYIIDGAGNFERQSALKAIAQFSDCLVTFSDHELDKLGEFLIKIDS